MRHGSTAARVFNIREVEDDIENALRMQPQLPPPPPATSRDVGRLTAEAIIGQYELAAREVEAMGDELKARAEKLEATKSEAIAAIDEIKETAARYRDAGKRVALQIEDMAAMTAEVRETCGTLRAKIAGPSA